MGTLHNVTLSSCDGFEPAPTTQGQQDDVTFPKIAAFATRLELFINRLVALAPRDDVIDMQNDAAFHSRAATTRSATK
jgi:hypothetical protein